MTRRRGDGVPADASLLETPSTRRYTQSTAEFEAESRPNALEITKETTHGIVRCPGTASISRRAAQVFLVRAQDMDNIINVEVASEFPGGLGYNYFPSSFVLEIGYKQVRDSALNFNFNITMPHAGHDGALEVQRNYFCGVTCAGDAERAEK